MSVRPQTGMWRILLAGTALSLLGVLSAFIDYGLANGLLWSQEKSGFRQELSRLGGSLLSVAAQGTTAPAGAAPTHDPPAPAEGDRPPPIVVASMTPVEAELPPHDDAVLLDISREMKADRLTLAEVAVPKLVLPENEPVKEGASAVLFLLSPPVPAPAAGSVPVSTPIVAGPVTPPLPSPRIAAGPRNPFVTSATAASKPQPRKYGWGDLVRMASMKGGNGEEPPTLFGALSEKEFRARELRCMATAIYFEARGEPTRGQIAVGQVIMTRVRSDHYPNTICGVVFQGQWNKGACQFSFACDGVTDAPKQREQWAAALDVAKQVISGKAHLPDIAEATHYHAVYVRPPWIREVRRIKQIGVHIFYKAPYVNPLVADADYQMTETR